jgi:heme o synthase
MPSQALQHSLPLRLAATVRAARELLVLTKPRITLSSTLAATAGMAAHGRGWADGSHVAALGGIALCVASACAFNMWFERETDAMMPRTSTRPLPSGNLDAATAFAFAVVLALSGLTLTAWFGGPVTAGLSFAALVLYSFVYTPLKRVTPGASLVGIIPGAIPPIIGAFVLGAPPLLAWMLAGLLAFWQLPHLLAVALRLQPQYEKARLRTLLDWLGESKSRVFLRVGFGALAPAAFVPAFSGVDHWALWTGCALSALIALVGLLRSATDAQSGFSSRWYVLATVLYVVPLILGAIHAGPAAAQ